MPIVRSRRPIPTHCAFCEQGVEPDYKNPKLLKQMMTDKGKILSRSRTAVCMKHQRWMTTEIKKARYMALLPYVALARSNS